MTLGISDAMTLYSAAWVPLHMTLAAPVAVERTTASSRGRPFSSARARAATYWKARADPKPSPAGK